VVGFGERGEYLFLKRKKNEGGGGGMMVLNNGIWERDGGSGWKVETLGDASIVNTTGNDFSKVSSLRTLPYKTPIVLVFEKF